jgi:hypothetical protein
MPGGFSLVGRSLYFVTGAEHEGVQTGVLREQGMLSHFAQTHWIA